MKNVYRLKDGQLRLVYNPFTEDWDDERRIEKAEEILSGQYATYCAFEGNRVVGEIMLLPRLNKDRLIIDSFHVSSDYRRRGIGRALLDAARQEALKRGGSCFICFLLQCGRNNSFLHRNGLPPEC